METIAKILVILFGIYLVGAAFIMLFKPEKARQILRKAGSTNFINYAELTLRMIPAIGLIFTAHNSRFETAFTLLGWFMLVSSIILMMIPRRLHHGYSVRCAEIIKPVYFQVISLFSFLFGALLIYAVT